MDIKKLSKYTAEEMDKFEEDADIIIKEAIKDVDKAMERVNIITSEINDIRTSIMNSYKPVVKKKSYDELIKRSKEDNIKEAEAIGTNTKGRTEKSVVSDLISYFTNNK